MLVVMGFPRSREDEALMCVEINSVEMAMEWLFSHLDAPTKEYYELVQVK